MTAVAMTTITSKKKKNSITVIYAFCCFIYLDILYNVLHFFLFLEMSIQLITT